jgi:hypothetical protein
MPEHSTEKRIVMAHNVARRWIGRVARVEYRIRVLYGATEFKNLTNLLRCFRDGKVAMKGLSRIADMGIKEDFDGIDVWSSDYDAMVALNTWFEERGLETSGVQ